MGSDLWCREADLFAVVQGCPVSDWEYFEIRNPAGPLEAVLIVVGSAVGTAADPLGCSVAAFETAVDFETLKRTEVGWLMSPWRRGMPAAAVAGAGADGLASGIGLILWTAALS